MMRRVLVDHARARAARKRQADGDAASITLAVKRQREVDLLDLDRALDAFATVKERFEAEHGPLPGPGAH